MILKHLRLHQFRAHQDNRLSFAEGVNLLYGLNGAGKTNILEAVHYLCLSKSFLTAQDQYVLKKGARFFELEGHFAGLRRPELKIRLAYTPEEGKRVFVNGAPLERLADLVGMAPVVVFSPEDYVLTAGGPDERRRFLNNILSQARPVYLNDLMQYRRALRQRNELLGQYRRRKGPPPSMLEAWDTELVQLGSRLIAARLRFLQEFTTFLDRAYGHIAQVSERPTLRYAGIGPLSPQATEAEIEQTFREQLAQQAGRERERGTTLVGPQRDELVFKLDGMEVRRFASQGQHRTYGMALKLAKYFYLEEQLEEPPILLLDDVFDHLDETRRAALLALMAGKEIGQSLLTAPDNRALAPYLDFNCPENREIKVEKNREGPRIAAQL